MEFKEIVKAEEAENKEEEKPYTAQELLLLKVHQEEEETRKQLMNAPVQASGFHKVSIPLTDAAKVDINKLKTGEVNWVQLSLDAGFKEIQPVKTETIKDWSTLSTHIVTTAPQFYLFNFDANSSEEIVLIYCLPEKGTTIKNRMVYSTCKAALAESLSSELGFSVKKFDIRDPKELTEEALKQHLDLKVASIFTPSQLNNPDS